MKKEKKTLTIAESNARLHRIGRFWLGLATLYIITIPLWMSLYWDVSPDWSVFGTTAVLSPLILMALSGIVEPIIYAPMVGVNGMYLSFVTGNLSNLKIPCVVKAQEIVGAKPGTPEGEVVATLAVAISSLVTIVIIGLMVLGFAFANLRELVEENEFLQPAFATVVYALFGSLGGKYLVKNPKLAVLPFIICLILAVVLGLLGTSLGSTYLFIGIAVTLVFAVLQFMREKRKLREKEERIHLAAIAAGISDVKARAIEERLEVLDRVDMGKKLTDREKAILSCEEETEESENPMGDSEEIAEEIEMQPEAVEEGEAAKE